MNMAKIGKPSVALVVVACLPFTSPAVASDFRQRCASGTTDDVNPTEPDCFIACVNYPDGVACLFDQPPDACRSLCESQCSGVPTLAHPGDGGGNLICESGGVNLRPELGAVPAVSAWGMASLGLLLLTAMTIKARSVSTRTRKFP